MNTIKTITEDQLKKQSFFTQQTIEQATVVQFEHNEYIHRKEVPLETLFYLLEGRAKILKHQVNGKQAILQFIHQTDFIGELTLVGAEEDSKDVIAIGKTLCLAIPMSYAKDYLLNDPIFMREISRYIGEKLLKRMDHFSSNQTLEFKYRLAHHLLETAVDKVYSEKHSEIADYLGVSYRHLLYTLNLFKEMGMISKNGKDYLIDPNKIRTFLQAESQ